MQKLFGTSGIRGVAKTLFTAQFCFDIGRTFAIFLDRHKQDGVVTVGIDTRESSPRIQNQLISGLTYERREVIDIGTIPVSAAHYSILSMPTVASIMVTGSHIDMLSNGVKFFAFKEEILKEHEAEIEKIYEEIRQRVPYKTLLNNAEQSNAGLTNYVNLLLNVADSSLSSLKIVVDPGNGAQTETMRMVLNTLKQKAYFINDNIQEPLMSRDTEADGAFEQLQKEVASREADLGVGFDSDGDRVIFVDHMGNFIPGDYSGTILSKFNSTNEVVVPVNVSNVIDHIGKEVIRTKVGSPFVVAEMKKSGAGFGFESNGGGIHADIMMSRDGGTSLIRMLNALSWSKKSLAELVSELPKFYISKKKFDCPTEKNKKILSAAVKFLKPKSFDETDGLKLILDDSTWVLFRPSSNAAEFRVFTHSDSETKTSQLMEDALAFASKIANN
jgi:phosphomannomutase